MPAILLAQIGQGALLYSIALCVGTNHWTWNLLPIGDANSAAAAAAAIADRVVDTTSAVPPSVVIDKVLSVVD